jgi:glycosyltransferase involved in cell wall biosynthesis
MNSELLCEWLFTESSPDVGGQELQLLQQMRQLRDLGYRVALACLPTSAIRARAQEAGLRVIALPFRNAADCATLLALRNLLAAERPHCVVCHSGHDADLVSIAARLLRRRPRLIRSKTYVVRRPSRWSCNYLVDATMVPSEFLRHQVLENRRIDPARIHVVYPGVDFASLDRDAELPLPADLNDWLGSASGPVIAQVGMLRGEKGHGVALAALAELRSTGAPVRYVAAGAGEQREALLALARTLRVSERVWIGELRPVAPLLRRADLVVMPSTYEPLGMAQIEALGLGTPVVASRIGGIPETITHQVTGLLVAPGDVPGWATAMTHALTEPELMRTWGQRGCADVRQRFSVQSNTTALLRLAGFEGHADR